MTLADTVEAVALDTATLNTSFSKQVSNLQLALDSTSLGAFKLCPRLYYYQLILGYAGPAISDGGEENPHLKFGTLYHAASEVYDHAIAMGATKDKALLDAMKHAITESFDLDNNRPWISTEPTKTLDTLLRTLVWYFDHFRDDPLKTLILANGKPAVELSFRFNLADYIEDADAERYLAPSGEPYSLCGHLDRVVEWNDELWIVDKKAQPKTSKVLTPDGWTEIGRLSVGDLICSASGYFKKVKSLYQKGVTKVFKVEFADETSALCAEDHLWNVANDGINNWRVRTFHDVYDRFKNGMRQHIPITNPIQHPERKLSLDPYILGTLLGDGYLGGHSVAISTGNEELIAKIRERLTNGDVIRKSPADNLVWTITGGNTLMALRDLQLWGKLSRTKFIPQEYLFASEQQRRDLLQGLLDTDGTWDRDYRRYQTMSPDLARGVRDLVRSLGGSALPSSFSTGMHRVTIGMPNYPTGVKRRYIKEITQVSDAETVCIEIDSYDGLYLTDDYIVTHNTTKGMLNDQYFANYNPDNQISLYTIAGGVVLHKSVEGVVIDAAQIQVNGSRFQRRPIHRTPGQLEEWLFDLSLTLRLMEAYARIGYWPQNDKACSLFGGCKFRPICSLDPSAREEYLEAFYTKRTWDPLVPR